ncbi:aldolase [Jannaschia sp. Os4]|uniref:HpcH/HpaI aldolase family protein n=1 Tax=Jannaschia sp. Os4 TaxID=2807617 RepID=UPI00193AC0D4|nr:aldolase/citrate lyase family protein [Jannaschia sp. Os4]MBM2577613.1 aldolase [Jannaschia sp. Os4]
MPSFRDRLRGGEFLAGTFLKTPSHVVIEIMAKAGLDFVCIDAEHAPWGRGETDAALAVARAHGLPVLVRVGAGTPDAILGALDLGATGVVVPHVDTVEKAQAVADAAHFGRGGRGFAGSTRWAGYATRPMGDVLAQDAETVVIVQIEEPEGVDAADAIAAVDGIDALFAGPADLSVGYGHASLDNADLPEALSKIGAACRARGKGYVTWVPDAAKAAEWRRHGVTCFFVASEHAWMLRGAREVAEGVHALD